MKTVLENNPIFTPGTAGNGTLNFANVIGFNINRLMAVINQTRNTIIYAEAQNNLGWANSNAWNSTTNILTLAADTSSHSSSDILQVVYDSPYVVTTNIEEDFDPVNKPRVSEGEALMDTDFEYGLQTTKWEMLNIQNNRPTAFYDITSPLYIVDLITFTSNRLVSAVSNSNLSVGTPLYIQDSADPNANGWYQVESSANNNFTYVMKANGATNGSIFDATKTYVYQGSQYSSSFIPLASLTSNSNTVTASTPFAHNLKPGDLIWVKGTTASTNPPNGSWVVSSAPAANTFTFATSSAPTGSISLGAGTNSTLFARDDGYVIHRSYDGGAKFSSGSTSPGSQFIRQTRRYFRYQSGKGIQFSTGTIMKPALDIDSITSSGTTVTVKTKVPHNLQPGTTIVVSGCKETAYNGSGSSFTINAVQTPLTFTYIAGSTPSATPATWNNPNVPITISPTSWYGSTARIGMFDQQNGVFFEFDGQTLYAVKRSSTTQLDGNVTVTNSSNLVTGNGTRFASQLVVGDWIVIRGMSYRVNSITSDTSLLISPEYRGITISSPSKAVISKTIDTKIPQSQWNIDKMDGTGLSRFNIDLTKMQMFYIDYSWYGAGFVRWGLRDNTGNVKYAHKLLNNNTNTEAYMRSGNLPARYESSTLPVTTYITASVSNVETSTINVNDTTYFPSSGIVRLIAPGNTGAIEHIAYTGKTSTTLTGLTRAKAGGSTTAQTFTYSSTAPVAVELNNQTTDPTNSFPSAPALSHWGSSVIMDGKFDQDLNYSFNYGQASALYVPAYGNNVCLMAIRLAPSVDNGKTDILGAKDLINRMQLKLQSMDILTKPNASSSPGYRINLVLNGKALGSSSGSFAPVGGSSLSQIVTYTGSTITNVTGGESIYSFFTNTAGGTTYTLTNQDLGMTRDLGNSIIGGGTSNNVPTTSNNVYPDGPDIIYITATNLDNASSTVQVRLSWTEAQA